MTKPSISEYPLDHNICLDKNRYVIAVVGWHGKLCLAKRSLNAEDSRILAAWLYDRSREPDAEGLRRWLQEHR